MSDDEYFRWIILGRDMYDCDVLILTRLLRFFHKIDLVDWES